VSPKGGYVQELSGGEIVVGTVTLPDLAPFPDVATLTQKRAKATGLEDFLAGRTGRTSMQDTK
jgi:hypothetical protein